MFVPGKPFQPSLMFVGKARTLRSSGAPEMCFTRVGSWKDEVNITYQSTNDRVKGHEIRNGVSVTDDHMEG